MSSRKQARNAALGMGLGSMPGAPQLAPANSGAPAAVEPPAPPPPRAHEMRPRVMAGAVGAVSRTLDQFQAELQAAKDLAASGATVVEIEPADIVDSILKDRLEIDADSQAALVESIRQSGQQVPILVRRAAGASARYQIAYGHRRVAACRVLGRKVLAVVRTLSDEELLVAQGQENSSRTDLSYIERSVFALNLEKRGVSRETIMLALTTDKTELSKMISVARTIPEAIIRAIGPAPKAGRTRWLGLSQRLSEVKLGVHFQNFIASDEFTLAPSDVRFERLFRFLEARPKRSSQSLSWKSRQGREVVRGVRSNRAVTLTFDEQAEPGFGQFLFDHLGEFHEAFRARNKPPE